MQNVASIALPPIHHRLRMAAAAMLGILLAFAAIHPARAAQPITTDSRIKTLVYNANEVFNITTHYGYQSNIEFGSKETIDTVSIGDRVGWQVIPAGRRLFIRAMEENAHTNMTIVTNLRAYQFDLRSSSADAVFGSDELTYVVRFYYPDDPGNTPMPVSYVRDFTPPPPTPTVIPSVTPMPSAPAPAPTFTPVAHQPTQIASAPATSANNYRYTYSGPNAIAPLKIYDDGRTTYFKFPANIAPQISVITARGEALSVPSRPTADGLVAVDVIAPRFSLIQNGQQVIVYNEAGGVM